MKKQIVKITWVSVKSGLPPSRESCLVTREFLPIEFAYWDAERKGWYGMDNFHFYDGSVIAWAKLPKRYSMAEALKIKKIQKKEAGKL